MTAKTPKQLEAEIWAKREVERAILKKKIAEARRSSGKEPFDLAKLRACYEAIAIFPRLTIDDLEAEYFEKRYYIDWDDVRTLQQAAELIRYLVIWDVG